jgi:hypothetical protein
MHMIDYVCGIHVDCVTVLVEARHVFVAFCLRSLIRRLESPYLTLSEMPSAMSARLPVHVTAALPVIVFADNPLCICKIRRRNWPAAVIFSISLPGNRITAAEPRDAVSMPIEEYGTPHFLAGAGPGPAIFEMAQPSKPPCKFFTLPAFITHGLDTECAVPVKQGSRKHLCAIHH